MGKLKPLTDEDVFILAHCDWSRPQEITSHNWKDGRHSSTNRARTPTETRRLFKARREGWNKHKFDKSWEALEGLREALSGTSFRAVETAIWSARSALKFQGSCQMELAFGEQLYEETVLTQEERDAKRAVRKLTKKVAKLGVD
jgi:hypothetical protein